jgi:hypothetical protein
VLANGGLVCECFLVSLGLAALLRWCSGMAPVQDDITFKGVVFNEMKGVYSSPDSVNSRLTQQSLFPENTYAHDSGGDPVAIPDLSFNEFQVCVHPRVSRTLDAGQVLACFCL